ncbi:DUF6807 domain-containing protein [Anditalea andensis]|uniref:Methane oxygenase PmoA n=1 Tax=Anditalea andensis TaxID=1048983 RepID=A0A074KS85_9BACT|nr:PmoA family protein [Anditalea andensis]KEO71774.1 hypothetical protein EL17_21565 [Anditalea andensis]
MTFLFLLLYNIFLAYQTPIKCFELRSEGIDRSQLPIFIISELSYDDQYDYYLEDLLSKKEYPVQFSDDQTLITWIEEFPPNQTIRVALKKRIEKKTSLTTKINFHQDNNGILATTEGKPILFYQSKVTGPEGNHAEYYNRSGFIHPLYSPAGKILTDGFPKGHTHQNGIFNAWTNTTYDGEHLDFWNRQKGLGTIQHEKSITVHPGKISGKMVTIIRHISLLHGPIIEEKWTIKIYGTEKYYMFDLWSEQVNISQDTLFLNEHDYGGMAFRGSKSWNRDDSVHFSNTWQVLTSEGLTNETANHSKAAWVNVYGIIDESNAGLAVFGFPSNFRAPQSVRVHPDMPYWVYTPVAEGAFYIIPGQKYISRYRYITHDGSIDLTELNRIQSDLSQPVKVKTIRR